MGYGNGLGASVVQSVASLVPAGSAVTGAISSIESLLHIGGLTEAQKNDFRIQRVAQLFTCARLGNVGAARVILDMATTNDENAYPQAKQAASNAWAQLSSAMHTAALAQGPQKDTRYAGYCPEDNSLANWQPGMATPASIASGAVTLDPSLAASTGLAALGQNLSNTANAALVGLSNSPLLVLLLGGALVYAIGHGSGTSSSRRAPSSNPPRRRGRRRRRR